MVDYWSNFVRTGNPNAPGLPSWPLYDGGSREILLLRPEGSIAIDNFDTDHRCSFWAAVGGSPSTALED